MATFTKCRVCTCVLDATVGSYNMLQLPLVAHKFLSCTNLTISEEERLPSELCQVCYDQLEQLYAFRAKCIAADTKWRMLNLANLQGNKVAWDSEAAKVVELDKKQRNIQNKRTKCDRQQAAVLEIERVEADEEDEEDLDGEQDQHQDEEDQEQDSIGIYKCDNCGAQFLDEQRLLTHKRRHGQMPYPCTEPGCDRGYSHKHTLTLHMRKCHKLGKEHKSHICEYCGKVFDTMSQLRSHRYTHKDKSELPYACEEAECGRRFSSKQLLKVHMMRHAGIKNYRCSYCGVQKTTRTELKIHLNYHTLERTYSCRFCSKVCYSSSNLNKHMRTIHERARNYACSYCERSFTQLAICKQHELIHTGEKPHECEECGRHFRQKAALRTHYKVHRRQRDLDESFESVVIESVADEDICNVAEELEAIDYE
ncbi:zinc finger protein 135-like isoform X2 [Drosophila innubila]|uniref:zinc finger protein 135-like isoform X2 n=1 Tax=Drosophila innubila TaxID=198719 RepID=UPI00148D511B|nr:zinc finger protein 135-like isoform X2 [Drosophila innubila]